jgi:hypothetical protein
MWEHALFGNMLCLLGTCFVCFLSFLVFEGFNAMFNQSTRSVSLTPPSASTSTREEEEEDDDDDDDDDDGDDGDDRDNHAEYEGACDENVDHVMDGTGHAYTPIFSRNLSDSWRDNTNINDGTKN